ncbi:ATP-binding cassette domain-containing protein [Mesorhizobium sp. M7A.F.Ca.CA.001.07.2.1]|uniref:ATP-binding cassette domain-containing protein n=1 Tax=Mesorhizobium TaxID=68287 RepID=UPI000FCCD8DF|nr:MULTISPECIES: ABC transporter ATP-binding protein [Mesorhizobium]RVB48730.1 ATP-binding cassette domain-containing protein [Mesorhizobium sp. M7A.F.Ca.CA.004.05.1.1]MCF6125654.1 ATP-binding cassette domain-containing protein [Mesorhizobium ciceri]MCQ8816155.1 ATP-binding cassette domain-containing protein [Mesorhizobium sp. SEMIA396]RUX80468.1 ATP-binding cassette domain-containing protein [Mesorhizobium sp. M7A.F.Ca.CA.004.08.2.1]RUX88578.1 ATP-binding cassette domain-containing protein [M
MNANPVQKANSGANDAILQVDHLSMKFGGLVAIGDLSFAAKRGEITALIGPNGAGKTTVFNCITGFYKPSEGMITLNRNDGSTFLLERLPNHEIPARAKVARTFQNIRLFSGMTLLENLLVAQHNKLMKASGYTVLGLFGFSGYRKASAESVELAKHWLEKADLVDRADDPAGDLPYGAQRRLEIARAMCTGPELLCLDEPAAGLNPKESAALNELLIDIKNTSGTSILLIEHDMSVVMQISDHVVVLEYGRKISDGSPQSVRTDPRVIAAYLGVDDEEVEAVLTEVGDEDVIEQLDTGPDAAHGPGTSSSYLAGPVTDTVGHSSGERVTVAKGASKAGQVDARSLAAANKAASLAAVPAAKAKPAPKAASKAATGAAATSTASAKPAAKAPAKAGEISNRLAAPRGGKADNLTRIKGIGTVNEKKLNDHGIFHFDQIGAWKKADVEAAEAYLAFDGRIAREEWVKQARLLGQGKDTEFSRRVDAGKVATSHASAKTAKAATGKTGSKTAAKPVAGKRGGGK